MELRMIPFQLIVEYLVIQIFGIRLIVDLTQHCMFLCVDTVTFILLLLVLPLCLQVLPWCKVLVVAQRAYLCWLQVIIVMEQIGTLSVPLLPIWTTFYYCYSQALTQVLFVSILLLLFQMIIVHSQNQSQTETLWLWIYLVLRS